MSYESAAFWLKIAATLRRISRFSDFQGNNGNKWKNMLRRAGFLFNLIFEVVRVEFKQLYMINVEL
jgi:hypothetical protein